MLCSFEVIFFQNGWKQRRRRANLSLTLRRLCASILVAVWHSRCCAVKLCAYTVSEIQETVRVVFDDRFSWFHDEDPLVVEEGIRRVRVFYTCHRASRGCPDTTFLEFRLDFDSGEAWIANLQVAAAYRRQGFGRELVQVAEAIAETTGIRFVNVFPLPRSLDFWRKMGYTPRPCITRVLRRDLSVGSNPANLEHT